MSAGFYRFYDDAVMGEQPLDEEALRERASLGARLSSAGLERCLGPAGR
ncbi:MAG TPA: hypothetical protein IAA43_03635 [Candidatus Olsenella avicola]|nr:hypothetical protein [Olsenella sp. An285]HIY51018.1 hypothetical protein [Candidatus Olsenella avicola]